ncbi:MAG: hypothetical protein QF609_11855 [Gammaproteobacteria bacterium]|jgi:hypothetical protein|nr:hypothetical protein [Gammaproteobacteria bacterium]
MERHLAPSAVQGRTNAAMARLQGSRRYDAMDRGGRATQEAKAESNAGAIAEDATERPWLPRHLCILLIITPSRIV